MKKLIALVGVVSCLSVGFAAGSAEGHFLKVSVDRTPAVYQCGEEAVFTFVATPEGLRKSSDGKVSLIFSDYELDTKPETIVVSIRTAQVFRISRTLRKPGFLKLRIMDGSSAVTQPWTVAFSPEKIRKGSPLPADFGSWWKSELARAEKEVPLDPQMTLVPERSKPAFNMYRVSFASFGRRVYGTLSIPTKPGKHPLNVQIASHGFADYANFGGSSPNEAMLWFSVFPFKPDWEWRKLNIRADYDAMRREMTQKWGTGWECAGLGGKRTDYFFHPVIIAASRAIDWLATRKEIDEDDIVYNGGSQGGGLGMMLVALNGHFRKAFFGVPALTDTMGWLAGHESGWPKAYESRRKKPDEAANYLANMPYYDAANFCTLIRCPVRINLGMRDKIVPPTAIVAAFNCLATQDKAIDYAFDNGHGVPDSINARFSRWLREPATTFRNTGAVPNAVYDQSDPVNLPPLLKTFDGRPVKTVADWEKIRRPEILDFVTRNVYGVRPVERPADLRFEPIGEDVEMPEIPALRKRVRISFSGPRGKWGFDACVFLPKSASPTKNVPAFLLICNREIAKFADIDRKVKSGFFPVEEIVRRGYAAAVFKNTDLALDTYHVHFAPDGTAVVPDPTFEEEGFYTCWAKERTTDSWGAISVWAWGASRVLDWLETLPAVDAKRVAVVGHSRGGKTSLWAAASDTRFAMACVNDSGCCGAKLNHVAVSGSETIRQDNNNNPHWFSRAYRQFNGQDAVLPYDQHWIAALIAPRLLYIASAASDTWAGPWGEFLTARHSSPAWELYGKKGLVENHPYRIDDPFQEGAVGYHLRNGGHDLTHFDWMRYLDFADKHLLKKEKAK